MNLNIIELIKNMYDKTSQALKINNITTKEFKTYRGVRQGCIMSPRLFNLFINDIPTLFDDCCSPAKLLNDKLSCLMYADDLVLLSEDEKGLQNCLQKLHNYTQKWGLSINQKKVMIFQNNGPKEKICINMEIRS